MRSECETVRYDFLIGQCYVSYSNSFFFYFLFYNTDQVCFDLKM